MSRVSTRWIYQTWSPCLDIWCIPRQWSSRRLAISGTIATVGRFKMVAEEGRNQKVLHRMDNLNIRLQTGHYENVELLSSSHQPKSDTPICQVEYLDRPTDQAHEVCKSYVQHLLPFKRWGDRVDI